MECRPKPLAREIRCSHPLAAQLRQAQDEVKRLGSALADLRAEAEADGNRVGQQLADAKARVTELEGRLDEATRRAEKQEAVRARVRRALVRAGTLSHPTRVVPHSGLASWVRPSMPSESARRRGRKGNRSGYASWSGSWRRRGHRPPPLPLPRPGASTMQRAG